MPDGPRWPALGRLWQHVVDRPAGAGLAGLGVVMVVFAMAMFAITGSAAALGFAVLGVVAIPLGALLPRLERARFSGGPVSAEVSFSALTSEEKASIEIGVVDDVTPEDVDDPDEMVAALRHFTAGEALRSILTPRPDEDLEGVTFRIYLFDEERDRMVPVAFPGETDDDVSLHAGEEWEVGKGATGTAFETGQYVYVSGDAVWDETYGLTAAQGDRFKRLSAVASVPVVNAAGETIAVLTASTERPDGGGIGNDNEALHAVLARSMLVSRVLIDLLGWYPDRYPAN